MDTPQQVPPTINYDDFAKLELRVATVLECKPHANADKLLVLQIDLGNEKRQLAPGCGSMWLIRSRWWASRLLSSRTWRRGRCAVR